MEAVIAFVRTFKDQVAVPLAQEGALDADTIREGAQIYCEDLDQGAKATLIKVEKGTPWGVFELQHPQEFDLDGKTYGSVEHYRVASSYFGSDDDFAEYVRTSATPQLAHRRGLNAEAAGKVVRYDLKEVQEEELLKAYLAILKKYPDRLQLLKSSNSLPIRYVDTTVPDMGADEVGTGKNLVGKVLVHLRDKVAL